MRADEGWMRRAAALARRAEGWTTPNPNVGAIIVRDGRPVSYGYHQRAGLPHAERVALQRAGASSRGADLYVTLEPCSHRGRTPPCVDAIIEAGIKRVVLGTIDPNPVVNGRGAALLEEAGIEVRRGVLESVCQEIILPYWVATKEKRPFVHLKLAKSADGRIAPPRGSARWITGLPARRMVHRLRKRYDAVLVGVRTVLQDDPSLDVRFGKPGPHQPIPVVLDSRARIATTSKLMARRPGGRAPIILCSDPVPNYRLQILRDTGARVERVTSTSSGLLDVKHVLDVLWNSGIQSVLVEGGSRVAGSFLRTGLVNRITLLVAPLFLGGAAVPAVDGLQVEELANAVRGRWLGSRRIGRDLLLESEPIGG